LKKQEKGADGPWMVGGKYSYADLALLPWQNVMVNMMKEHVDLSEFTEVAGWLERLRKRPALKKVLDDQ